MIIQVLACLSPFSPVNPAPTTGSVTLLETIPAELVFLQHHEISVQGEKLLILTHEGWEG